MDDVGRPRLSRFKLRFEGPDLEQQFLLAYRAAARPWIRMSLVVALSTVLGFTVIDHWLLVGPRLARPDIWRFGLQLPLVLIMMLLTAPRVYLRWYQPAIQAAAPLFGVGTVLMAVEATPAQLPLVAARLLLAAFYFYFMLGLTFSAAVRTNLLLIAAPVAIYSLFVLVCANLIGGAGCYALEYANRVAFVERLRLAEVATHDALTGLLNRAALEAQAPTLWQQAQAGALAVSVMLIDVDHFKAYNDCYGHQAGDRCLSDVGAGGVLQAVADLNIAHGGSLTRPCVTVSVGVATVEPGGDYSHEHAVREADIALYAVKSGGRDGWSFHQPLPAQAAARPDAGGLLQSTG